MRLKLSCKIATQNASVTRLSVFEGGAIAGMLAVDTINAPLVMGWLNDRTELLKLARELLDEVGEAEKQRRKWKLLSRLVDSLRGET
jgi:hypothetical protein